MGIRPRQDKGSQLTTIELDNAFEGLDDGKADVVHVHAQSDVTGLVAALAAKSDTGHTHAGVYEPVIASGTASQVWKGNKTWGTYAYSDLTSIPSTFTPAAHVSNHAPGGSDALPWTTIHGRGVTGSKPAAAAGNAGYLYFDTTLGKMQRSTGAAWEDVSEAGSGGTPGGSDTQVQYNSSGSFAGSANFTFNGTAVTVQSAVAAASTDGLVLATTATATVGAQKFSPAFHQTASGWQTTTPAAETCEWRTDVQPVQAATHPANQLVFASRVAGGSWINRLVLKDGGTALTLYNTAGNNLGIENETWDSTHQVTFLYNGGGAFYYNSQYGIVITTSTNYFGIGTSVASDADTKLGREAAANWRLGGTASATPVAQTLSVQDGSGSNIAPVVWVHRGCRGTGDSGGAATFNAIKIHSFHTPDIGSTGSTLQTATEKFYIKTTGVLGGKVFTVANLPTGAAGERAFVSDATVTTFASTVAGGGANQVPVYHNGTNWCIG